MKNKGKQERKREKDGERDIMDREEKEIVWNKALVTVNEGYGEMSLVFFRNMPDRIFPFSLL